jgi:hypothetical protein
MAVIHFDPAPIDYAGSIITYLGFGTPNLFKFFFSIFDESQQPYIYIYSIQH